MAMDTLVVGTVLVTAAAIVTYRVLGKRGKKVPVGGGLPTTVGAPMIVDVKVAMMVLISLAVLSSSLFVILSGRYDVESQKWAFSVVGTIVGFWLRPEK